MERDLKYWITKNCMVSNCWLVFAKINDMLSHKNTVIRDWQGNVTALPSTFTKIEYVYLAEFSDNRVTTILQDSRYYYIIDNTKKSNASQTDATEAKEEDFSSDIKYYESLSSLIIATPKSLKKRLGLVNPDKIKWRATELTELKKTVPQDFIGRPHDEQVKLWKKFVSEHKGEALDMSGFYTLDPSVIRDAGPTYDYNQVILYQNTAVTELLWLAECFPKLKICSIWFSTTLGDAEIKTLLERSPLLSILELHICVRVTGRILIDVAKSRLDKLLIDNNECQCHDTGKETVITDAEWESINNDRLEFLLINSYNLTLDYIYFTVQHFTGLEHFAMNDIILAKLEKNSGSGYNDKIITFHSATELQKGFKRYRDVKVWDLIRSKFGQMFSESMLKIIRAKHPERNEAVDMLLGNRHS